MKKGIALFVLLLVAAAMSSGIFAQKVYSCQYKSDADVKVYVSQNKSDADLVVYETKWKSEATDNSGVWYFCEYKSDADRKIYFCDYKSRTRTSSSISQSTNRMRGGRRTRRNI